MVLRVVRPSQIRARPQAGRSKLSGTPNFPALHTLQMLRFEPCIMRRAPRAMRRSACASAPAPLRTRHCALRQCALRRCALRYGPCALRRCAMRSAPCIKCARARCARRVGQALFRIQPTDDAALAGRYAGWISPLSYFTVLTDVVPRPPQSAPTCATTCGARCVTKRVTRCVTEHNYM